MAVAALIVNFRVYEDLDRALASLLPALSEGDEVVVVDQSSDTARLAALQQRHVTRAWVPLANNVGFAAAINRATRETCAPHLLWVNPDTTMDWRTVRRLETWLDGHPRTGVVGPRVLNEDGSLQPSARRFPGLSTAFGGRTSWLTRAFPGNWLSARNLGDSEAATPRDVEWITGACLMTRRDLFERVGGLDEGFFLYWEDADYCRRIARLGFTCTYLPDVEVRHLGGRSAARDPRPAIRAFHASAYRMYRKHAGPAGRAVAPFVRAGLWLRGEWRAWRAHPGDPGSM